MFILKLGRFVCGVTWIVMLILKLGAGMGSWWTIISFVAATFVFSGLAHVFRPLTSFELSTQSFIDRYKS